MVPRRGPDSFHPRPLFPRWTRYLVLVVPALFLARNVALAGSPLAQYADIFVVAVVLVALSPVVFWLVERPQRRALDRLAAVPGTVLVFSGLRTRETEELTGADVLRGYGLLVRATRSTLEIWQSSRAEPLASLALDTVARIAVEPYDGRPAPDHALVLTLSSGQAVRLVLLAQHRFSSGPVGSEAARRIADELAALAGGGPQPSVPLG